MRAIFLILALATPLTARAVTVSRLYNFEADTPAQADQVNDELDNILSAINGNLDGSTNITQGSISTGNLASYSVTQAKLGAQNRATSDSSLFSQRASSTEALVPNLTGNITVVSRPVFVGLQAVGNLARPGRIAYRHNGGGATDNAAYVSFQRLGISGSAATVNQTAIGARSVTSSADDIFEQLPCSSYWFIDNPGPGPFNYSAAFRIATGDSGVITVENCQLVLFEL